MAKSFEKVIRRQASGTLPYLHHLPTGDVGITHPLFAVAELVGFSWKKGIIFSSVFGRACSGEKGPLNERYSRCQIDHECSISRVSVPYHELGIALFRLSSSRSVFSKAH